MPVHINENPDQVGPRWLADGASGLKNHPSGPNIEPLIRPRQGLMNELGTQPRRRISNAAWGVTTYSVTGSGFTDTRHRGTARSMASRGRSAGLPLTYRAKTVVARRRKSAPRSPPNVARPRGRDPAWEPHVASSPAHPAGGRGTAPARPEGDQGRNVSLAVPSPAGRPGPSRPGTLPRPPRLQAPFPK